MRNSHTGRESTLNALKLHANVVFWNFFQQYVRDTPDDLFVNLILLLGSLSKGFHQTNQTLLVNESKRAFCHD